MTHCIQRLVVKSLLLGLMTGSALAGAAENDTDTLAMQRDSNREALERQATLNPVAITVYKRNYLMPYTYNTRPNASDFREIDENGEIDHGEVKFQFSVKVGLIDDLFGDNGDLYFAYTQRSWWQAYNSDASSPFRETNYEPELFMSFDNGTVLGGWINTANRVGFVHQSNGRSDPLSRSWNRIYLDSIWQNGDWTLSVAPFWRVPNPKMMMTTLISKTTWAMPTSRPAIFSAISTRLPGLHVAIRARATSAIRSITPFRCMARSAVLYSTMKATEKA